MGAKPANKSTCSSSILIPFWIQ